MKKILLLVFLIASTVVFSQSKNDTLHLFYKINETESPDNKIKLDSLLKALSSKKVKVKITGYADFLYTPDYNLALSQKRAELVKEYISGKSSPDLINIVSVKGKGEAASKDNNSKEGDAWQRRVDIIVETSVTLVAETVKPSEVKKKPVKETKKNIEDLSTGESIALEGLQFQPGRHFITKASIPVLEKLLQTLKDNPTLKVEIQGHVCCVVGDEDGMDYDSHDKKLSENRAKAIYDYLVKNGIDADRLSFKGYARSRPKFPAESTPAEEQANRRVEILVIEK